jgi:hypothetical protein
MDSIGRVEGVLVGLAGLYFGAITMAVAIFAFMASSAPGSGKIWLTAGLFALLTASALFVAWKLFSRPSTEWMVLGAVLLLIAATGPLLKALGISFPFFRP